MNKSVAVFISKEYPESFFDEINEYYKSVDPGASIFIVTDTIKNTVNYSKFAIMSYVNMFFYNGKVLFLEEEDLKLKKHDKLQAKSFITQKENMYKLDHELAAQLDEMLLIEKNKIRRAKNAELQSILR